MAIYYVKNGGSNAADGLSDGNAWETLAYAFTTATTNDTIQLKRGSIWREALDNNSPSAGQTITDYDTGDKPSIRGSDTANSTGNWTYEATNLWYLSSITADPVVFAHDGTLGQRQATKVACDADWDYWYDSGNSRFYVYLSGGDPTESGK